MLKEIEKEYWRIAKAKAKVDSMWRVEASHSLSNVFT
jgi:hypothetical protein